MYKFIYNVVFILPIISISLFINLSTIEDRYFSEQWGLYQENGIDIKATDMYINQA
ncbi:MAG: hypothetical protein ACOWWR_14430 [Eubacteriales bacterium]